MESRQITVSTSTAVPPEIKSFKKVKNQNAEIALSHAIASGNFGWTEAKETALIAEVARIAAEKGRTGSSFRDSQFRANVARNIRHRDLRAAQASFKK